MCFTCVETFLFFRIERHCKLLYNLFISLNTIIQMLLLRLPKFIFHVLDNSRHDVVNESATLKPRDYEPPVTPPTHLLRPKMIGSKITKSKLNRVRLTTRRPKPAAEPTTPSVPQVMDASFCLCAFSQLLVSFDYLKQHFTVAI